MTNHSDYAVLSWLYAELKWAVGVREAMPLRRKIKGLFINSVSARSVVER